MKKKKGRYILKDGSKSHLNLVKRRGNQVILFYFVIIGFGIKQIYQNSLFDH